MLEPIYSTTAASFLDAQNNFEHSGGRFMSSRKNKVPKPFRRGRCRACRSPEQLRLAQLCERCEQYANQDEACLKEAPIYGELLEKNNAFSSWLQNEIEANNLQEEPNLTQDKDIDDKAQFYKLLNKASLSKQQRKILKLRYLTDLTFQEIAEKLKITLGTIQTHYQRGLKKLSLCLKNSVLVRGEEEKPNKKSTPQQSDPNKTLAYKHTSDWNTVPGPSSVHIFNPERSSQ